MTDTANEIDIGIRWTEWAVEVVVRAAWLSRADPNAVVFLPQRDDSSQTLQTAIGIIAVQREIRIASVSAPQDRHRVSPSLS